MMVIDQTQSRLRKERLVAGAEIEHEQRIRLRIRQETAILCRPRVTLTTGRLSSDGGEAHALERGSEHDSGCDAVGIGVMEDERCRRPFERIDEAREFRLRTLGVCPHLQIRLNRAIARSFCLASTSIHCTVLNAEGIEAM